MPAGLMREEEIKVVTANCRGRIIRGAAAKAQKSRIEHMRDGHYVLTPVIQAPT